MKKFLLILALSFVPAALSAQQSDSLSFRRHEVFAGVGDVMYEKAVFHNTFVNKGYRHSGHFFAGYQYSVNTWFSAGAEFDFEKVKWNTNSMFYNISVIPEARFTYMRGKMVSMYSGVGMGLLINGGTENDFLGRKTVCAPVFSLNAYSVALSFDRYFAALSLGGLFSLKGKNEIYMLGSRLISLSIGVRL